MTSSASFRFFQVLAVKKKHLGWFFGLFWPVFLLPLLGVLVGCGGMQRIAISQVVGPMVGQAAGEMEQEGNWQTFRRAIPGNLKFLEGLVYLEPNNLDLLAAALKANSGYAFGVLETLWLGDKWRFPQRKHHRLQALHHYSKGIHWGLRYLQLRGMSHAQLLEAQREGELPGLLGRKLEGEEDLEVVFFLAQSMGSFANLHKTSPMALAQLPLVKAMFDWVCAQRPGIRHGACFLFYGAWEAGRPALLGGNLAAGKRHFLQGIEQHPKNYLMRVAYLRFYVIPTRDRLAYRQQRDFLRQAFRAWGQRFWWTEGGESYRGSDNLYNAIARKQFTLMVENEKWLF